MKERLKYLDLASGIMTVWVLYFHALFPIFDGKILSHIPWLYFFMPWFFYKSGMMFTPKDPKIEWHNGLRKLIRTYFIWSAIGYVVYVIWHFYLGDLTPRMAFYSPLRSFVLSFGIPLNGAVWFLPILFLVRQFGNYLLQRINAIWIVMTTLALCVFFRVVHIPYLPNFVSGTAWGLFFFSFAYWIKNYEIKWWMISLAAIIYIVSVCTQIPLVYGEPASLWCRLLWYPSCAFACIFFNNVCRWLVNFSEKLLHINQQWSFPVLSYIGHYAMNFYVPHYMIFRLVFDITARYNEAWYSGWQGVVIITIAYALILQSINLFINHIHSNT